MIKDMTRIVYDNDIKNYNKSMKILKETIKRYFSFKRTVFVIRKKKKEEFIWGNIKMKIRTQPLSMPIDYNNL